MKYEIVMNNEFLDKKEIVIKKHNDSFFTKTHRFYLDIYKRYKITYVTL